MCPLRASVKCSFQIQPAREGANPGAFRGESCPKSARPATPTRPSAGRSSPSSPRLINSHQQYSIQLTSPYPYLPLDLTTVRSPSSVAKRKMLDTLCQPARGQNHVLKHTKVESGWGSTGHPSPSNPPTSPTEHAFSQSQTGRTRQKQRTRRCLAGPSSARRGGRGAKEGAGAVGGGVFLSAAEGNRHTLGRAAGGFLIPVLRKAHGFAAYQGSAWERQQAPREAEGGVSVCGADGAGHRAGDMPGPKRFQEVLPSHSLPLRARHSQNHGARKRPAVTVEGKQPGTT